MSLLLIHFIWVLYALNGKLRVEYCVLECRFNDIYDETDQKRRQKNTQSPIVCLPHPKISTIRHTDAVRMQTLFTQPHVIFTQTLVCVKHEGEV